LSADGPILVVDDYADAREILCLVLETAGYAVCTAANGMEAVEVAAQRKPALILMDIFMPGMDGITAAQQIKGTEAGRAVPIIACTARTAPLDAFSGFFVRTLTKPFSPDDVLAAVRTALGERAA
jgi:CheY-like chemotaxis protein